MPSSRRELPWLVRGLQMCVAPVEGRDKVVPLKPPAHPRQGMAERASGGETRGPQPGLDQPGRLPVAPAPPTSLGHFILEPGRQMELQAPGPGLGAGCGGAGPSKGHQVLGADTSQHNGEGAKGHSSTGDE